MSSERKMIYLCLAHMSEAGIEQKYVKEAFDTNWVVPMGPNVNAFEQDLSAFVNEKADGNLDRTVVCLSAGTAAVHLALIGCGVQAGDEVIVQSFTFCASSHPITYLGAKPVFVGSEKDTWNMDPELLEKAILDRKEKTGKYPKAIVPVALYGMPYDCEKIMAIADKYGIPVVEDAAEGMGSRFDGQVLGTFGKYGVLSFNGNKMITTSGGGALICQSKEDANEVMWYATQARDAYPYYQHTAIGYNYRMSNVCAGIGRGQMTVLNDHIAHHKHVQALYEELLAELGWDKESVDALIFESVTGDYKTPPTSCLLQDRLGLSEDCFCVDIPMGCCGCMYAVTVGGNLLTAGNIKRVLLLIGDTALRMGSLKDKSRVPLFGDCGTAVALEFDPQAPDIIVDFHTYGRGYEALMTPHGGFRHPATPESFEYEDFGNGIVRAPIHTMINGMNVFSFAISRPPKSIEKFMSDYSIDRNSDIDYYLIHQANKMIVDRIVKKLKLPIEKVPYNLEQFGNLGGASIPSLMVTRLADQLRSKETVLLMSSFGLGLSWGTMKMKTQPMVVCDLVEI